jgi:hypothetical protein
MHNHPGTKYSAEMSSISSFPIVSTDENQYFAGLIDAQLSVAVSKNGVFRVLLTCHDSRIATQIRDKFDFTRITTISRPGKKDACTCLFLGDGAKTVLEFAAAHCVVKKQLAVEVLKCIAGTATIDNVRNMDICEDIPDITLDWASGFFDVRGIIVAPQETEEGKKRRGSVRVVVPKVEKFIIPALQKVLSGSVKKSSPCRLVFESKDSIRTFSETVRGRLRVKKNDLEFAM